MRRTRRSTTRTRSHEETRRLGAETATRLREGLWVALTGPLGSGKSVFVRGVCDGLGVEEDVLSPTFILYEAFEGRLPVVHLDLYRLEPGEVEELGLEEIFQVAGSFCFIEWPDRLESMIVPNCTRIDFEFDKSSDDARLIAVSRC